MNEVLDFFKDLLKSDDRAQHILVREMIRREIRRAKQNEDDKLICDLLEMTKPYQKTGNKLQRSSFDIVWFAAKEKKLPCLFNFDGPIAI